MLSLHPLMAWMLIWESTPFQKVLVLKAQSKFSSYVKPLMRPITNWRCFFPIKAFLFSRGQIWKICWLAWQFLQQFQHHLSRSRSQRMRAEETQKGTMPGPSSLLDEGVLTQMLACDVSFPGSLSWHSLSVRQRRHCFLHVDGSVTATPQWQEELRHIKIWSRDVAFQAFYSLTPNSFPAVSPLGCQVGTYCRDMAFLS